MCNAKRDGFYSGPWKAVVVFGAAVFAFAAVVAAAPPTDCVDEKKPVRAALGTAFSVCLKSNPTTGYRWRLSGDSDDSVVKLTGSRYERPESKLVGAGGREIFSFMAVGLGKVRIRLEYARSWEKNTPPAKETVVEVTVHPPGQ
jgi:predicted secreted protein